MSYVQMNQVAKTFNKQKVLNSIDLHIQKGKLVTLLGPSGCGKSTLLRILSGLTPLDSGTIHIDGKDVTAVEPKDREIGMVFQSYALFPNMTVSDNIAFGLTMKKMPLDAIRRAVGEMLELTGLQGKEKSFPRELSGGQQQRVALARSLVTKPKLLLLDEPLSALDAQIRKNLQQQLRSIQRELNMTTVLVTHDQEEAMAVSDHIYIMNAGNIAQHGSPQEIYTQPSSEFVARFIGSYNVWSAKTLGQIAPEYSLSGSKLYAIRPETFSGQPLVGGLAVTGIVRNVTMLGNIMRVELCVHGEHVVIDQIHRHSDWISVGATTTVYLHPKDVIPLHDATA
ncbi:ABC transporter ATP-binding protein [Paenibacillus alvei]|uniref:ABC transporter ATP-binding protein n=1 Tax=Paenibacillus alvei TaxID=44250 RepID=UPI0018CFA522|nr:ABC transporter ATP-binding protein [Paenibacillus alvei]MBG9737620.1 ABC transporter ATP-binding protein [Paenibacillus alvei]MBG9747312.1 ABC transporter ATP-binding protein [Paenibacillus alvei]MCY9581200.1 ABC transporter ATP-binding protein [Paenibacillus alvei]MCY9584510.1 ABC transporter ATP-binding protein [Paenibacillus alvei]